MDSIKGAIVLRQRFAEAGVRPEPSQPAPDDALPIFHWVATGEVPQSALPVEEAAEARKPFG